MDDDIGADMLEGFEARSIIRHPTTAMVQERQQEQRKPIVDQVADAYPEVNVEQMEKDGVRGRLSDDQVMQYYRGEQDFSGGAEVLNGVVGGVRDGIQEAMELVHMVGYALSGQKQFMERPPTLEEVKEEVPDLPEVEPISDSATEAGVRGVAQFFSVGGPVASGLKKLGIDGLKKAMLSGAAADSIAFDPADGNLSTLMNELELGNDFTEFMATENDGQFEGRLKNSLEGAGIGAALDSVLKASRKAKAVGAGATASKVEAEQ